MKQEQTLIEYMDFLNEKSNKLFQQLKEKVHTEKDTFWLISKCNEYNNFLRDFSEVLGCKL